MSDHDSEQCPVCGESLGATGDFARITSERDEARAVTDEAVKCTQVARYTVDRVMQENAAIRAQLASQAARLTLARFQEINADRCGEAFKHGIHDWSLMEWACAAAGEMGEAANVCKKIRRKETGLGGAWAKRDPEASELRSMLADEIGDTLAYLSLLASAAGLSLEACAANKFDVVSDRVGWPGPRLAAALSDKEARDGE